MKLIGDLKEKVENAKTKEEARDTIKEAGMLLDDEELDKVSGGGDISQAFPCIVKPGVCTFLIFTGGINSISYPLSRNIFRPDTGELFTRSVCHDPDTFGECDHANSRNHSDIHCLL